LGNVSKNMTKEFEQPFLIDANIALPPASWIRHIDESSIWKTTFSYWDKGAGVAGMSWRFENTAKTENCDKNIAFALV